MFGRFLEYMGDRSGKPQNHAHVGALPCIALPAGHFKIAEALVSLGKPHGVRGKYADALPL
jgi:hypothetical protein